MRLKGYIAITLVCLFYWILDSIWSFLSFERNLKNLIFSEPSSYLDTFLFKLPPYQMVSRLMVISLFIILGAIILEFFIRKQAAEKMHHETNETLVTVLNSIDATIYVSDLETYEVLFMNQRMIDRFHGNAVGRKCYEVFRQLQSPCPHCSNDRLVDESGQPSDVVIWEGYNPVTDAWYVNYDRAIKWVDGRTVRLQIATDISRLKELQEQHARSEAHLRQSQKMESIGRLAGGVAHDLNNLLFPVLGYSEILLAETDGGDPRRDPLQEIMKAATRARDLVHQLLAFSRKQVLDVRTVDLNALLEDFEKLLRRAIREDITISLEGTPSLPCIQGDRGQLEQVVMNLAVNAQDAMPDGGALKIETTRVDLDERDEEAHKDLVPGSYVLLTFRDTGCGIDPETRERLFEPFFTTKEKGKGTGLGLATVYGIVKQHGGHIAVESEAGRGTAFKMLFPVAREPEAPSIRVEAESHRSDLSGSETILLAEDNEQVRDLAVSLLAKQGYRVLVARSGQEAMEVLERHSGPLDLVLSDVIMPEMNGRQLFEKLSATYPKAKALFMSGYNNEVIEHHGLLEQGIQYLQKPFTAQTLAAKVREVLEGTP